VRLRHEVLEGIDQGDLEAALRVLRAFEAANHLPVANP
jgi:MarR family transcriptional regulator for hemolysin